LYLVGRASEIYQQEFLLPLGSWSRLRWRVTR